MANSTNGRGASAPSNVVRLPTAARRQVRQFYNRDAKAARKELPRFPDRFIFPGVRAARRKAELIRKATKTPELALALALFEAMDEATKLRVLANIQIMAIASEPAEVAEALIERRTIGEQANIKAAARYIEEGKL